MTTKGRNRLRPTGHSTVQQSQYAKIPPSNNSTGIQIRFGKNQSSSIVKPQSILKKQRENKPYDDHFNENVTDWQPPSDLEFLSMKQSYSPIGTPPRLRTLITPPGLEPYRNTYSLRRLNSPLPTVDDWYGPPAGLDTWGIDPTDYRLNQNLHLIRRYPSPLTHFGLGNNSQKQKKSYIVVPRLSSFNTPPISRDGAGGTFTMPPVQDTPSYIPDSQYSYLERIRSHPSTKYQREPSDYIYIRRNDAFANRFIEDFISKCIEDQFIPDILLEIISELDRENKNKTDKSIKPSTDQYYTQINNLATKKEIDHSHLFSDAWIRELDYQRPHIPSSNIDSNISLLKPLDFREIPYTQIQPQIRYHDLHQDDQGRVLRDISQELINQEVENMVTEITGQTVTNKLHNVPAMNDATNDIYRDIESEVVREIMRDAAYDIHNSQRGQVSQVQFNAIEKQAQNKLLDTIFLDQLIGKYIKQNGSVVDVDDLSRFLDATILDNLIYQYEDIQDNRSRTLDNYALRKFHLNSFMNMTMDLLLTELSASLIEDMKDLDEQERRIF
ncbi:unnamed protein product [Rotaria magnacalcarata]|uniref:Uncharacterized protein n=2 Tax=Rotaria magnacalcarata TaxID=392030 RepID=A0A816T599_9BILA|nr:unnamed protein product [Rotaria magnacalcarata]CAF2086421.1 unnamed protein product [Rotaria magnacalcarata]CAF2093863.1 unnamed protein product [Rotaria magnacalcarata]CAF3973438.1 unnamed protein product [Rotaria magnacalcarata]CAF4034786.1 unnamed protein product [Rotaria magnacalcarata]